MEDVKGWISPDGDPGSIAEKALTNMVFEKAVEYHRSPTEFIAMQGKQNAAHRGGIQIFYTKAHHYDFFV